MHSGFHGRHLHRGNVLGLVDRFKIVLYTAIMKTFIAFFAVVFSLSAQIETAEYRFAVTQPEVHAKIPFISALPWAPNVKPAVLVTAFPKEGVPLAKEHHITLRWEGKDGKTYRQTLTGTRSGDGILALFDVEAAKVLSVDVERVTPPVIQEAQ